MWKEVRKKRQQQSCKQSNVNKSDKISEYCDKNTVRSHCDERMWNLNNTDVDHKRFAFSSIHQRSAQLDYTCGFLLFVIFLFFLADAADFSCIHWLLACSIVIIWCKCHIGNCMYTHCCVHFTLCEFFSHVSSHYVFSALSVVLFLFPIFRNRLVSVIETIGFPTFYGILLNSNVGQSNVLEIECIECRWYTSICVSFFF